MWWMACFAAYAESNIVVAGVYDTLPRGGAVGVPIDARMVVLAFGGGGPYDIDVVDEAGNVLATTAWDGQGGLGVLTPPDVLLADSSLALRVSGATWVEREAWFGTGTGRVQGIEGLPAVRDVVATRSRGATTVTVDVAPAADPDELSLLRASFAGTEGFAVAQEGAHLWLSVPRRDLDEVCVDVTQIDALGRETAPVVACADVSRGCATGPGGAAAAVVAAAIAIGRRQRPGRPAGRQHADPR